MSEGETATRWKAPTFPCSYVDSPEPPHGLLEIAIKPKSLGVLRITVAAPEDEQRFCPHGPSSVPLE